MDRKTAKELLHIRDWLDRAHQIVALGEGNYHADTLLQEAGDSLMMKVGEAANRVSRAGFETPEGVEWSAAVANRNWLIHQYDQVDRAITWATLATDLMAWRAALAEDFAAAEEALRA